MNLQVRELTFEEVHNPKFNILCFLFGHKLCKFGKEEHICCMRCEIMEAVE